MNLDLCYIFQMGFAILYNRTFLIGHVHETSGHRSLLEAEWSCSDYRRNKCQHRKFGCAYSLLVEISLPYGERPFLQTRILEKN